MIKERQQKWKINKFYKSVTIEAQMSLNLVRNRQPSFQQSRVSSSSSSSSQGYELIPRQQPFFNPTRDIASPKASFPFRKVQAGNESSMGGRSNNESRSSIKGSVKDENESKDIIEVVGEFHNTNRQFQRQRESIKHTTMHEECNIKIKEAQQRIEELQKLLYEQRFQFDLQRKANEIYTQGFARIRQLIIAKGKKIQGESIEQLVQKLTEMLEAKDMAGGIQPAGNAFIIIQQQDKKIRELRAQLLRSTQNNINAIFNTEITEAYLLQGQIQKMNAEIISLKEKLIKATADNQESIAKILQNNSNSQEVKKIVKYYKLNWESESEGEEIGKQLNKHRKGSKQNKLRDSRERSSSQNNRCNIQLISTQNKVNDLIQGFNDLKGQYSRLAAMLTQISNSQTNFKQLFPTMIKDITQAIQTQIKQLKQSSKRPSSSHQQLRIARQMEVKLNDLVNMFNSPQKVNIERSFDQDDNNSWKNVEVVRKLAELESKNSQLQQELKKLNQERDYLHQTMAKTYVNKPPLFSDI